MKLTPLALALAPASLAALLACAPAANSPTGGPGATARPAPWLFGGNTSTCVVGRDNQARCWGRLDGPASAQAASSKPLPLQGFSGIRSFGAGAGDACAILESGKLLCAGTTPSFSLPPGARRIAVGAVHACALMDTGRVLCWGGCGQGECGPPSKESPDAPRAVEGLSRVSALALGLGFSCAIVDDGKVVCWGDNQAGQLGDGSTGSRPEPRPVSNLVGAIQITARKLHACALLRDRTVRCWGLGDDGQLGDGVTRPVDGTALVPVPVVDLTDVDDIAAGNAHTCALRKGEVYCWGSNQVGQLGSGSPTKQTRPARVPDLEGITAIAAGSGHQCAAAEDGSVWCWGNSFFGQAGGPAGQNALRPQRIMQR